MKTLKQIVGKSRWIIIIFVGTALLYFLSEGFAYRLMRKHSITHQVYSSAYRPIIWVDNHSKYFENIDNWYETLWHSDKDEVVHYLQQLKLESTSTNE